MPIMAIVREITMLSYVANLVIFYVHCSRVNQHQPNELAK